MSVEKNKQILQKIAGLTDQGLLDEAFEYYSTECIFHNPGDEDVIGLDAMKERIRMNQDAFPDMKHVFEDFIGEADKVVARYRIHATHTGELMGVPATGKKVSSTAISIFRFADGKIVEMWGEFDTLGLLQQIGAVKLPK